MATEKRVFRRMDSDTADLQLPQGSVRDMLNVRVTNTENYNLKGNTPHGDAVPSTGDTKTIGTLEDKQHDRVIYFNWNSAGIHRIINFNPFTYAHTVILEWDGFDWMEDDIIEAKIVDDILVFITKGRGEIYELNINNTAIYDGIKATDSAFLNLIKRPPFAPLIIVGRETSGTAASQIGDIGVQVTFQYVYEDNQYSTWAPFSSISPIPYLSADRLHNRIKIEFPNDAIPPLVKTVRFAARINNTGGLVVFQEVPVADVDPGDFFYFTNSVTGDTVDEETAVELFDSVPRDPYAIELARNRLFVAGYTEGYDYFDTLSISFDRNVVDQTGVAYGDRIFKTNSNYRIGIIPSDYAGRTFGVISKPEWSFDTGSFYGKDGSGNWIGFLKDVTATVTGTLPSWVKSFQVAISENLNYSYFIDGFGYLIFDFGVKDNVRALGQMGNTTPVKAYLRIASLADRKVGYAYEEGDYVNIYYQDLYDGDPTGNNLNSIKSMSSARIIGLEGDLLEIETPAAAGDYLTGTSVIHTNRKVTDTGTDGGIVELSLDTGSDTLVYEKGNFMSGCIFEIYRPNTDAKTFYAVGDVVLASSFAGSSDTTLYGDVTLFENTAKNTGKYVSYLYESGGDDHYVVAGVYSTPGGLEVVTLYDDAAFYAVRFPYMEAMSAYDLVYTTWNKDNGKPAIYIPNAKEVYKKNYERFSNKYLSGTQINGLNSFEGLNEKELPVENGAIQRLMLAANTQAEGTVLLAIQDNETESQYLNEVQYRDTQGNTTVAISDAVIGSNNTLRGGLGTINPESVVSDGFGNIYFWDATKGEPVRYAQNGNTPLATTYLMKNFFYALSRLQLKYKDNIKVFGGYDVENNEYIMSFTEYSYEEEVFFPALTIAYSEREKGFTSRYGFQPIEPYAKSNTLFYSCKNGVLYEHNSDEANANSFYGDDSQSSMIRFISNSEPSHVKVFQSVGIEGQLPWVPTILTNERGQQSYMKVAWFRNKEGIYYAAIRRDTKGLAGTDGVIALNTGDKMRGRILDVTLEISEFAKQLTRLDAVDVTYIVSLGHTRI